MNLSTIVKKNVENLLTMNNNLLNIYFMNLI